MQIFHAAPCRQQVNICNHNGLCFLTGAKEEDPTSTRAFKMSASLYSSLAQRCVGASMLLG
jgi:hypothetical protein